MGLQSVYPLRNPVIEFTVLHNIYASFFVTYIMRPRHITACR
jgi:hypothetical protein